MTQQKLQGAKNTTDLKVMWLNAENLFLLSDMELTSEHLKLTDAEWQKLSTSIFDNKSLLKCRQLAKVIQEKNPDILSLCEVGGLESLKNFNRLFLEDKYSPVLIEGNSDRHIDLGFLVKRNLPFYFDLVSNRNRSINFLYPHEKDSGKTPHKFSRDVAELHLFLKDRDRPFLILLSVHLKSRLDPDGIDPSGLDRREAEMKTLLEIYQELETKHGKHVPMALLGDFNGNASALNTDAEFQIIYQKSGLKDVGEIAGLAAESRATFYQVQRNSKTEGRQLDYCFLSPSAQAHVALQSIDFYRYKNHLGEEMDPPKTLDAKLNLPSDHYPICFDLRDLVLTPVRTP